MAGISDIIGNIKNFFQQRKEAESRPVMNPEDEGKTFGNGEFHYVISKADTMMCMSLPVVVAFRISEDFRIIGVEELTEESAESVCMFPAAKSSCELFFCMVLFTSK